MISHHGSRPAASCAQWLARAAVSEKLPAAITPVPCTLAASSISVKSAADRPEVPMMTRLPAAVALSTRSFTESGRV